MCLVYTRWLDMVLEKRINLIGLVIWVLLGGFASADAPETASPEEVYRAAEVLEEWANAYLKKDFEKQWALTHPRIQKWHGLRKWGEKMKRGMAESGGLVAFEVEKVAPVLAKHLPCTEQGHCYRKDVQVVLFLVRTEYRSASPNQPETIIMAKQDDGWLYGGGTFPNRPFGETLLILDRKDELRYRRFFLPR